MNKLSIQQHISRIVPILEKYNAIPYVEQKTEEWLNARTQMITASEAGYLLGIKGVGTMINYITNKIYPSTNDKLQYITSIQHGNIFEDVSRMIYETRHNVKIQEYGLITSDKHNILGASPDGIVSHHNTTNLHKIGRIIEIKNPYKYDDTDFIKPEYMIQIYQQQYVLELPICDFIKTNIISSNASQDTINKGFIPYKTLDDMLFDTYTESPHITISNLNIPIQNLNSKGMEKGLLITYKLNNETKIYLYPINITYNKKQILEWINHTKTEIISKHGTFTNIYYWYIAKYHEQSIEYNAELYENHYIPRLKIIWNIIKHLKKMQTKYDDNVISNFINTQIKTHLNKSSTYYKNINNSREIYTLLQNTLELKPNPQSDCKLQIESQSNKKNKKIELDF